MRKLALALMAAAAASATLGVGVVADAYPPPGVAATVDDSSPAPGGPVRVTMVGCVPPESVAFELEDSTDSSVCVAGPSSFRFAAPTQASAVGNLTAPTADGTYTGSTTGVTSGLTATFTISVRSASQGELPKTGSDGVATTTLIAGGLLIVGLGLFAVAQLRRRRSIAT